ncbi:MULTISPECIES: hypothetical protein [Brevibacillus]|jgi:hypothetical protein|uniref:hypothetical protein n=1 Tax=Brevibacillus TaxID=55080 RepID=UPI001561F35A|nr:hypothetical protein [Brevibacillus borstelensis]MBE5395015.1 hypothetical protein [Brevibacillus borstelensis]MCM3623593.1 hypothetical protein [Brevibacillus borstelensis]MED2006772.1 hypothetical protein [Brevibacillus borstelensis]WNF08104.1 hypothetical protein RFB14_12175 [Brevibacillus borstelensis]
MNKGRTIKQAAAGAVLLTALAVTAGTQVYAAPASTSSLAVQATAVQTSAPQPTSVKDAAAYITKRYGITLSGTITKQQFEKALETLLASSSIAVNSDGANHSFFPKGSTSNKLLAWEAISASVKAADLKELAHTYSDEKISAAWDAAGLTYKAGEGIAKEAAQEVAVAFDTGFLSAKDLSGIKLEANVSAELAYQLLNKVAEFHGEQQNFLGTISDDDIFGKLVQAWNESQLIRTEELQKTVDEGLKQNLITGYNLKDTQFDPHFDPARTITYGHSDIVHAVQLVGLLRSEGIAAKVQLEPKTSAFVYLKEWGEPVQTDDYQVVPIDNGNHIAYAKEYDLSLEFATVEEKEKFQPLVLKYAKRNQEDMTGLLKSSWWQPLYYSLTKLDEYPVITNNVLKKGRYLAQTFTLNEDSAKVVSGLKKINPSASVETYQFWVDQPFYNYLKGDYK